MSRGIVERARPIVPIQIANTNSANVIPILLPLERQRWETHAQCWGRSHTIPTYFLAQNQM